MHLGRFLLLAGLALPGVVALGPDRAFGQAAEPDDALVVIEATGGLRSTIPSVRPDARYQTATQTTFENNQQLTAEELRRFGVPDNTLVTGSVPPTPENGQARAPVVVTDPYAAVGIRRGPLTWFPALDVALGYDSNIDSSSNARGVRTLRLSPELRVESDWARHAFSGLVRGSMQYVDDGRDLERSLAVDGTLRLDVGLDSSVDLRGAYQLTGESASDANAATGVNGTTDTHTFEVGASLTQPIGPLELELGIDGQRSLFGDSPLTGGGTQSNSDRNRSDFSARLRLSRGGGPYLRPFGEVSIGARRFDEATDRNGFDRNSWRYGLRGGLTFAEDGLFTGEVAVGLDGEVFDDAALDDVVAVGAAASLTWDVTALTSVTLDVETSLNPTTQAGSGVGITRSADLGVTHALRRNVDLRLGAGINDTQFSGINDRSRTYETRAGLTWRISPVVAFRIDTTYEHEPDASGDVDRFTAEAGITLRR